MALQETSTGGPPKVPVYCLTLLSEQDHNAYKEAFAKENIEGGVPLADPYFIEWSPEEKNGRTEGDLDDMYRIWRSQQESAVEERGWYSYTFFIDRQSVQDVGILVAGPDTYSLCHSDEGTRSALELVSAEQREAMEMSSKIDLARQQEKGKLLRATTERLVPMWAGDILSGVYADYPAYLGQRDLPYGRMPATGLPGTWCNIDIGNMGMSELIEFFGRKDEVKGEGIVYHYMNPESKDDSVFLERFSEMVDKSIESEKERLGI